MNPRRMQILPFEGDEQTKLVDFLSTGVISGAQTIQEIFFNEAHYVGNGKETIGGVWTWNERRVFLYLKGDEVLGNIEKIATIKGVQAKEDDQTILRLHVTWASSKFGTLESRPILGASGTLQKGQLEFKYEEYSGDYHEKDPILKSDKEQFRRKPQRPIGDLLKKAKRNLAACSNLYVNIKIDKLASFLNLTPQVSEQLCTCLITSGQLKASIDQVARLVTFTADGTTQDQFQSGLTSFLADVQGVYEQACNLGKA